jgi:hypothetical protein
MGAPTKESLVLKRERAYYTDRMCRVDTTHYRMSNGTDVEDITLECPREILPAAPKRSSPRP